MIKRLSDLLCEVQKKIDFQIVKEDGISDATFDASQNVVIENLVFDSRNVLQNSLFFALPGTHTTGNAFIADAIKSGAVAVVFQDSFTSKEAKDISSAVSSRTEKPIFIKVPSARFAMSPFSAAFYDNPSSKMVIIGVTGTEGKSSTVSFIWQLLRLNGIKSGFISTVQFSLGGDAIDNPEHQTTPEATIVQRELYEMLENGCTHAVVEASSHGLSEKMNRLGDVLFDCSIFMNVTLEHLEFHGSYEQYKSDKANLFRFLDRHSHEKTISGKKTIVPSLGIVNLEDPAAEYFASCTKGNVIGFTAEGIAKNKGEDIEISKRIPCYSCREVKSDKDSIKFFIDYNDGFSKSIRVSSPVSGAFNAYNITASILAVNGMTGFSLESLAESSSKFESVKGRMTSIDEGQPFEVIVDYAHTPSSFETVLPPIRKRAKGKVICVFGSGGERDTQKRPLQGEIAARFCDIVILTDEDPRKEDRNEILNQIAIGAEKGGKKKGENLFLVPDRREAIRKAFSLSKAKDIVLLLGKSHEKSIIYADRAIEYDEIAEAKTALKEII